MILKNSFLSILFALSISITFGQDAAKPLYELIIFKTTNDQYQKINRLITIDSSGNIFSNNKLVALLDIKKFNEEINKFVNNEKVIKYPGSDKIIITEAGTPSLNTQLIYVTIRFSDDMEKEEHLPTKTYYSWSGKFDKSEKEYLLYQYLSESEVILLKTLLE